MRLTLAILLLLQLAACSSQGGADSGTSADDTIAWRFDIEDRDAIELGTNGTELQRDGNRLKLTSNTSLYDYQLLLPPASVVKGARYRLQWQVETIENEVAVGVLDLQTNTWIGQAKPRDGKAEVDFTPGSDRVRVILFNNNDAPRRSTASVGAAVLRRLEAGEQTVASFDPFEGATPLWGTATIEDKTLRLDPILLPASVRLAHAAREADGWSVTVTVERLLDESASTERREIEDVGILIDHQRLQAWWGDRRAGGVRLYEGSRLIAEATDATLGARKSRLGFGVDDQGDVVLQLDDRTILTARLRGTADGATVDLASRNSSVRWSEAELVNLVGTPSPSTRIEPSNMGPPSGPMWSEHEAVPFGFQPVKSHLWNRWLGRMMRDPREYAGLPWLNGGESPLTHGPMLGFSSPGSISVGAAANWPARVDVVGGEGTDPAQWNVLTTFSIEDGTPFGHGDVVASQLPSDVSFTFRVDGRLVDTREDGQWPVIRRRWGAVLNQPAGGEPSRIRFLATCCDNLFPSPSLVWPQALDREIAESDFMVHLGDLVYEQSYRRRKEVSRLDYLASLAPGGAPAARARLLPMLAVFDDHELFNDITAAAEPGLFAQHDKLDGPLADVPWRIASRDIGRAVWEEAVGWTTPHEPAPSAIFGMGTCDGRGLVALPVGLADLTNADALRFASLIAWPGSMLGEDAISPPQAGVYRIVGYDAGTEGHRQWLFLLEPPPPTGTALVQFSASSPRYGSVRAGAAELILLDTRTARTAWAPDPAAPGPTILGEQQKAWLLDRIRKSDAPTLILVSSVTFSFHNGVNEYKRDSWTGYAHERDEIFDALQQRGGRNVILSGDLHNAAVRELGPHVCEVLVGSWSNAGVCGIRTLVAPVREIGTDGVLWAGPEDSPHCDWITYATFVEIEPAGEVSLRIMNLATGEIEFTHRID